MNIETLQEIVCQAHMVGQHNQSGVDPSWSEAFAYWKNEVEPKLTSDNSDYAKCANDILKLDLVDAVVNKHGCLVAILKRHFA